MIKPLSILLSLLLFGCNSSTKKDNNHLSKSDNCIAQIFEQDSIFGHIRNYDSEKVSLSQAITNYAKNLKSLDFSDCPKEFELAFSNHVDAWLDFRKVSDKYTSPRGELHDIFSIIEKSKDSTEFKSRLAQIIETWKTVEESSK